MRRARRIYEALLRTYPERTRLARGEDMAQLFADQLRDAETSLDKARVWVSAIADLGRTAPREHLEWRRRMKVVEGPGADPSAPVVNDVFLAALPMLVVIAVIFVRPPGFSPMLDDRVSMLGLPLGVAGLIPTALIAGFGVYAARRDLFRDPGVQVRAMCALLAPVPVGWVLGQPALGLAAYAIAVVTLVLALQLRWLALLLLVPCAMWLVAGPSVILILINLNAAGINA